MSAKDEAVAVDSNIAFYAFYLFVGIETVVALTVAPHDALGVMCHHRRRGGLPAFATNLHDELFDTMIQIPFQPPLAEIAVHGLLFGNGRDETLHQLVLGHVKLYHCGNLVPALGKHLL